MTRTYYEQQYCNECISVHWVEVTRARQAICHGEQFSPQSDPTHYTRRLGHGVELIETVNYFSEVYESIERAEKLLEEIIKKESSQ